MQCGKLKLVNDFKTKPHYTLISGKKYALLNAKFILNIMLRVKNAGPTSCPVKKNIKEVPPTHSTW